MKLNQAAVEMTTNQFYWMCINKADKESIVILLQAYDAH